MDNRIFINIFPTIFVTGLKEGEGRSKQVSIVFKAVVYATLNLKVKY